MVQLLLPSLRPGTHLGRLHQRRPGGQPADRRPAGGGRGALPRRSGLGRRRRRPGGPHGHGRRRPGRARAGARGDRRLRRQGRPRRARAAAGHALKAINNTMLAAHILAAAEGLPRWPGGHPLRPRPRGAQRLERTLARDREAPARPAGERRLPAHLQARPAAQGRRHRRRHHGRAGFASSISATDPGALRLARESLAATPTTWSWCATSRRRGRRSRRCRRPR